MEIYTALHDAAPSQMGAKSQVLGMFSTEERARAACQAHADGEAEQFEMPQAPLEWGDTGAGGLDGTSYDVVLGNLDEPLG